MIDLAQKIKKSSPGKWEAFFERIPLFGRGIASDFEQRRFKPIVLEIEDFLKKRSQDEVKACWEQSPHRYETALRLMEIVREHIGWNMLRFIPDDPLFVVFWAHEDGLDTEEAKSAIEKQFNFIFSEREVLESEGMRFGEFVDLVDSKATRKPEGVIP